MPQEGPCVVAKKGMLLKNHQETKPFSPPIPGHSYSCIPPHPTYVQYGTWLQVT